MTNDTDLQRPYEKQLVFHLMILLKAIDQYQRWGKRALASDDLRNEPEFDPALRTLSGAMDLCAKQLLALPEPTERGWAADQLIRKIGFEAGQFAESLEIAMVISKPTERAAQIARLEMQSKAIKQGCRLFGSQYDQVFPGRLDSMYQLIQAKMETE